MKRKKFLFLSFIFLSYIPVLAQVHTAWIRKFTTPGYSFDVARALAVDDSGNVYVAGDTRTIKYSEKGNTIWVGQYPRDDIAVDYSGKVYVTHSRNYGDGTSFDYETIKYDSDGDTLWVRRYNGPGNSEDRSTALAVDNNENLYVTGYSGFEIYNFDYATVKYSPSGETLWVRHYNGTGNGWDRPWVLVTDGDGNVYVTGISYGSDLDYDIATVKYSSNGDSLWVKRYSGSKGYTDLGWALTVDGSGNVYVAGLTDWNPYDTTSSDYITIKYAPNGDSLWVKSFNGSGNGNDAASDLAVDNYGNVYVTGYSWNGINFDYTTIKYNAYGDALWVRGYNGNSQGNDMAAAIVVDDSGNVYVTGTSDSAGFSVYATICYNSNGNEQWIAHFSGAPNVENHAFDLAVDRKRDVYVTGWSIASTGISYDLDYATVKYTTVSNTPAGSSVSVLLQDSLSVTFDSVAIEGYTSVNTDYIGPEPPMRFLIVPNNPPVYYDILTSATHVDSLTLCFTYGEQTVNDEDSLRLFHRVEVSPDSFEWQDVTVFLDTFVNQICGRVASLSKFVLAEPIKCLAKPGDANTDGSVTLPDIIYLVNDVFKGGPASSPLCRGDANADGNVNVADIIYLVNRVFKGGPAPLPSEECCL